MNDQYRLGIDIGGTFTDGILLNEIHGRDSYRKGSIYTQPTRRIGFLNIVDRMLAQGFPRSRGKCPQDKGGMQQGG